MNDCIIRAITEDGFVKISAAQTTKTVERASEIHNCSPLAAAALGRLLTAAAIMGDELKGEDSSITLQVRGDGPLGTILAVSDSAGNPRGYVKNPSVNLPLKGPAKLNVSSGVGKGLLAVIKEVGAKEPFTGQIELQTGEIAEDIAAYYMISEQIPAACSLGVLVDVDHSIKCAGGYIIQLMPGAPEALAHILECRIAESDSITTCLDRGMSMEDILNELFHGMGLKIVDRHDIEYRCRCTSERVERALLSIGKAELTTLAQQEEQTQVTCQFCDKVYTFTKEHLLKLADKQ